MNNNNNEINENNTTLDITINDRNIDLTQHNHDDHDDELDNGLTPMDDDDDIDILQSTHSSSHLPTLGSYSYSNSLNSVNSTSMSTSTNSTDSEHKINDSIPPSTVHFVESGIVLNSFDLSALHPLFNTQQQTADSVATAAWHMQGSLSLSSTQYKQLQSSYQAHTARLKNMKNQLMHITMALRRVRRELEDYIRIHGHPPKLESTSLSS